MNVGTIAKWLNLPPEKQIALEKAWEVASVAAQGVSSRPARILLRQQLRSAAP